MPMVHFFSDDEKLFIGYLFGRLTVEDIMADADEAFLSPQFSDNMNRLYVFHRSADGSRIDMAALQKIQRIHTRSGTHSPSSPPSFKIAFVTSNELQKTMLKLYSVIWDLDHQAAVHVLSFYDTASALDWLGHSGIELPTFSEAFGQQIPE